MSPSPQTEVFLARLSGVKRCGRVWKALCPVHSERTASLVVKQGDTGVPIPHCYGCGARWQEVAAALGLARGEFAGNGRRRAEPPPSAPCATPETLNAAYRALLAAPELRLLPAHARELQRRGLSEEEIRRRGYRSMPIRGRAKLARDLAERFSPETMASVPGWCPAGQEGHEEYPTWHGSAGILIPVRNVARLVVALKVRVDDPQSSTGKYLYVSSTKHDEYDGPSPGCPVHVPLFDGAVDEVRVTEGELKADVVTAVSGVLTLGLSGVNARADLLRTLEALG